jgi:hypothetical protein
VVQFQMTGNGPTIVSHSAINPRDGTGVNGNGQAPFNGQCSTTPAAGTIGVLQNDVLQAMVIRSGCESAEDGQDQ